MAPHHLQGPGQAGSELCQVGGRLTVIRMCKRVDQDNAGVDGGQEGLTLHRQGGGGPIMCTGTSLTSYPAPCPPPPTWSAPPAGAGRRGVGWWSCH